MCNQEYPNALFFDIQTLIDTHHDWIMTNEKLQGTSQFQQVLNNYDYAVYLMKWNQKEIK